MDAFSEKIMKYVDQHALLSPGDRIVVGLSGGADSVCLLLILRVISGKMPLSLCAVHVEHGIRGQEALEDTAFCRQLCETRGIPFREVHCDVPGMARREGLSLEEAGRKARYETFARVREEWGGTKIAVAHHREDQAGKRGADLKSVGTLVILRFCCLDTECFRHCVAANIQ